MATLIGDLVHSRRSTQRESLHHTLIAALDAVNEAFDPLVPLRMTVGDEYQGGFATVGAAVRASLRLRLALVPDGDVRHGIGWGETRVLQEDPRVEDGPGWWVARDAIVDVEDAAARAATRLRRTAYRRAEETEGPDPATLEAMLLLRDQQVGALSDRSLLVLRGLLAGTTQRDLAAQLGVSASAVSQRVRADGLAAIVASDLALEAAE